MDIKQSVQNTFKRVGIDYKTLQDSKETIQECETRNRFTGEAVKTTPLIAECISKIYDISNQYELGTHEVKIQDFDRIRYFVAEQDSEAYMVCLD